jgi:hypothetical protein
LERERLNETASRAVRELRRVCRRAVGQLGSGLARLRDDARTRLVPWLRHRAAIEHARGRLWWAAAVHGAAVVHARIGVVRASRSHRARCRRSRRAVLAVEKEEAQLVARASDHFHELCRPQRLARYGPYSLLDNGLTGPDWEVSLQSVRAVVVPPAAPVLKAGGTPTLRVPAATDSEASRRSRLLIRSRRGLSTVDCSPQDAKAREFAQLVNVAALNPEWFQENRHEQIQQAADRLEAVRALSARRITDARAELEHVLASTDAVEEAHQRVCAVRSDTGERDRRREALTAIKRQSPQR